jgi:hypothetical protein
VSHESYPLADRRREGDRSGKVGEADPVGTQIQRRLPVGCCVVLDRSLLSMCLATLGGKRDEVPADCRRAVVSAELSKAPDEIPLTFGAQLTRKASVKTDGDRSVDGPTVDTRALSRVIMGR